jgi:hypothetical protein
MRIYVASSWRNERQPAVVQGLESAGHQVYDFRHPGAGARGFHWREIDLEWQGWSAAQYRDRIQHPIATQGFRSDMRALESCDCCVLVMPCGRSAHLEAGWAKGAGKRLVILLADGEPELMYRMADALCLTEEELLEALR